MKKVGIIFLLCVGIGGIAYYFTEFEKHHDELTLYGNVEIRQVMLVSFFLQAVQCF